MGQSIRPNDAAEKDAQTELREEDYVKGTGHITIRKMDLLHLGQNLTRPLPVILFQNGVLPKLYPEFQEEVCRKR